MDTNLTATPPRQARSTRAGIALLAAGLLILVGALASELVEGIWVAVLLGMLALVYGAPGVHDYQAPADGAVGRWGALLVRYGGGLVALVGLIALGWEAIGNAPDSGPRIVDAALAIGFVAFVVGVVLFAMGIIRAKVLPVASGVLMLLGIVGALAIDMATGAFFEDSGTTTEWGFFIGVPLFAIGLAWAGYAVWKDRGTGSRSSAVGVSRA